MYRMTTDQNAPDAVVERIDLLLDENPQASDQQIAKLLEIEDDFQEVFSKREAVRTIGMHIESTGELASKVWGRRMRRDLEKIAGHPLPPSRGGPFDAKECAALLQKAVADLVKLDREMRRLQAIVELRNFFLGRADLTPTVAQEQTR